MSHTADGPHPLTPADLPDADDWWHGCLDRYLPLQSSAAGLTAHHSTVHTSTGDPRRQITIRLEL
ncbi:hypothetical protein [Streptomyces sp. NPDC052701]|uniref:hypothetical protein n=1 Tax=Streptomyces sp. NPDC052701 TaxID=3155533 RepID=UPI0034209897